MTVSLDQLRQQAIKQWDALQSSTKPRILVGTATCGRSAGATEAREAFEQKLQEHGLDCEIIEVGCVGLCYAEPIVCVIKPSQPGVFENLESYLRQEWLMKRTQELQEERVAEIRRGYEIEFAEP